MKVFNQPAIMTHHQGTSRANAYSKIAAVVLPIVLLMSQFQQTDAGPGAVVACVTTCQAFLQGGAIGLYAVGGITANPIGVIAAGLLQGGSYLNCASACTIALGMFPTP